MPRSRRYLVAVASLSIGLAACDDLVVRPHADSHAAQLSVAPSDIVPIADPSGGPEAFLIRVNRQIAARNGQYAVREASLRLTSSADPNRRSIVFANDRVHRINYRFVKGDPRRDTVGPIIRQATFPIFSFAPTTAGFVDAKPIIDRSFATWSSVTCAELPIINNLLPPNIFPSAILDAGGFDEDPFASDINTVGFLPGVFFDLIFGPGGSSQILAVTFPFVFIDDNGNPTDIDGDNNDDAAFAEIWYNGDFVWSTVGTVFNPDIESTALHENGHALGLGHFGKISFNTKNWKLHVSPRAVMNAIAVFVDRLPLGTDEAAFCAAWANWN